MASERIAEDIAAQVERVHPLGRTAGKRGRGRPKDVRAELAGHLARYEYEFFTGQQPGRSWMKRERFYGPYVRFLQVVLDNIGSKTKPITIILAHWKWEKDLRAAARRTKK